MLSRKIVRVTKTEEVKETPAERQPKSQRKPEQEESNQESSPTSFQDQQRPQGYAA